MGVSFSVPSTRLQVSADVIQEYQKVKEAEDWKFGALFLVVFLPLLGFNWIPMAGWSIGIVLTSTAIFLHRKHLSNVKRYVPEKTTIAEITGQLLMLMMFLIVAGWCYDIYHVVYRLNPCVKSAGTLNNLAVGSKADDAMLDPYVIKYGGYHCRLSYVTAPTVTIYSVVVLIDILQFTLYSVSFSAILENARLVMAGKRMPSSAHELV